MIKASGRPLAPELLAAPGADFNARLEDGLVPLHWACAEGKAGVLRYMLEHGANVLNAADGPVSVVGRAPLYMAIHSGNFQTVMLVIDQLKALGAPPADEALKKCSRACSARAMRMRRGGFVDAERLGLLGQDRTTAAPGVLTAQVSEQALTSGD